MNNKIKNIEKFRAHSNLYQKECEKREEKINNYKKNYIKKEKKCDKIRANELNKRFPRDKGYPKDFIIQRLIDVEQKRLLKHKMLETELSIKEKKIKLSRDKKSNITECFNIEINKRNYTPIEKTNIIRKKSKSIKNKKKDEETDEIRSLNTEEKSKNLKEIVLNNIKEKVVKINISDLNKEIYEGKCFCFLIMSDYYIKKFFKE